MEGAESRPAPADDVASAVAHLLRDAAALHAVEGRPDLAQVFRARAKALEAEA